MHKILLPVDGSESALRAVRHVIRQLEGQPDARVTLLYVHQVPVPYGAVGARVGADEVKRLEREAADPVLAGAEELLRAAGVAYEREFRVAEDIAPMIARRADELGVEAIVMGTHGGGVLARMITGSTASKVLHLAKVPVTFVK